MLTTERSFCSLQNNRSVPGLGPAIILGGELMAAFSVRVELHRASWDDYVTLATLLAAQGIFDTIRGNNGVLYKLPPAEYNFEGAATGEQVREAVALTASRVVSDYAVVVSQATTRFWIGLQPISEVTRRSA
jgi:hypothetical protein